MRLLELGELIAPDHVPAHDVLAIARAQGAGADIQVLGESSDQFVDSRDLLVRTHRHAGEELWMHVVLATSKDCSPDRRGPGALVIPGGSGCLRPGIAEWAARIFRGTVAAVDWLGRGRSTRVPGYDSENGPNFLHGRAYQESFNYHNVNALARVFDVVATQPTVEATRLAVIGGSWGGYYSWMLASLDSRISYALPTFGCGGFSAGIDMRYTWEEAFRHIGDERREEWCRAFDVARRVHEARARVYFETATNDKFFALPAAMDTYHRGPRQRSLMLVNNQDHFTRPYNTQAYRLLREWVSDAGGDPLPHLGSVLWDHGAPIASVACADAERVSFCVSEGDHVTPFGRAWRTVSAAREGDRWVAQLPIVDPQRSLWLYAHAERAHRNTVAAASTPVWTTVPAEMGVRAPSAAPRTASVALGTDVWAEPVGDRISPKADIVDGQFVFHFDGEPLMKGVIFDVDGDALARDQLDAITLDLHVHGSVEELAHCALYALLVTDYHGFEEQAYGIWLRPLIGAGGAVSATVRLHDFAPVDTRARYYMDFAPTPLDPRRICGLGVWDATGEPQMWMRPRVAPPELVQIAERVPFRGTVAVRRWQFVRSAASAAAEVA